MPDKGYELKLSDEEMPAAGRPPQRDVVLPKQLASVGRAKRRRAGSRQPLGRPQPATPAGDRDGAGSERCRHQSAPGRPQTLEPQGQAGGPGGQIHGFKTAAATPARPAEPAPAPGSKAEVQLTPAEERSNSSTAVAAPWTT